MKNHVRDTVFGHLVRSTSKNKFFKYPDETDSSLWKQCIREVKDTGLASSEQHDGAISSKIGPMIHTDNAAEKASRSLLPVVTTQDLVETKKLVPGVLLNGNKDPVYLVDWYGQDDPENPQNWSNSYKLLVTTVICLLNFAIYIASSIYTPGEASIMKDFGVSETVATLGLSLYALGYGLGPMILSPMSEIPRLGRSGIYFYTLLLFVLFQLPTGYATNMPMFLVFRFVTGFLGSPALATGGATIGDIYPPSQVAYMICIYGFFGILGPVFGPLVGGFAAQAKGWRWTIWEFTWLCSAVLIIMFFLMPETSSANILYRRAKRLRRATGNPKLKSQSEIEAEGHTFRDHAIVLSRAFTLTFFEPIVLFLDLYTALLYGVLYIWFESFPLVFGDTYHFNTGQQGLVFLGIFVGGLLTVPFFLLWIKHTIVPRFVAGDVKPEMLLPPTFFGSFALPICLFWYGWTSSPHVHWIVPIVGSGLFTTAIIALFNPVLNYLGLAYPAYAASVFAGNALFRASFGAIFPLFARALFRKLGIGPGNSLLGGLSILFIPIPFTLYYYGERIRHASKNARHDM